MILLRSYIGQELRQVRLSKEKTLRDVAASACVSLGYLSEVERGLKEASSEILLSLCDALEMSMSSLLSDISSKLLVTEIEQLLARSDNFKKVGAMA
jgi:transcriptional regulator with XRE-family HTH domain